MATKIDKIYEVAKVIKNEVETGANTAERVGYAFEVVADAIKANVGVGGEVYTVVDMDVMYAVGDSDTTPPSTTDWKTTFAELSLEEGAYVWSCTKITYSDEHFVYTGEQCLGKTSEFATITEMYYLSEYGTTEPADDVHWMMSYTPVKGCYLWTCSRITWTDGSITYMNKRCTGYFAVDGTTSTVTIQYSTDGTNWLPIFVDGCVYARFSTDGGLNWTEAFRIVGESGSETKFDFAVGSYPDSHDDIKDSDWQDEPPTVPTGKYLWMRMQKYDGNGNKSGEPYYARVNGKDGVDGLAAYDVMLSRYEAIITVDDMGNVIGGLWTEAVGKDENGKEYTMYQYRISTAVFAKKGDDVLLYQDGTDAVEEGHYRVYAAGDDCSVEIKNGTIWITDIENIKDGVSGSGDDTNFDYDEMRKMSNARVSIVVELEGKTSKTLDFNIRIQHDSLPFMVCDLDNEMSSVVWNTKTAKYIGLPFKSTASLTYHNELWQIESAKVVSGLPDGISAEVQIVGKQAVFTFDGTFTEDAIPSQNEISVTITGKYAGAVYEYTKVITLVKSSDSVIYELIPSDNSIIVDKDKNLSSSNLSVEVWATSSDDKRYQVTDLGTMKLKYGIDSDPSVAFGLSDKIDVNSGNQYVSVALYDAHGNTLDKETVPLLAYGEDGNGVEFVFQRTKGSTSPTNGQTTTVGYQTPSDWETNKEYQSDDYVPSGWTDDAQGISEEWVYEWSMMRKYRDGVWQPFSLAIESKHFGKHAAQASFEDELVTIPTDSDGTTLLEFSEDITASLYVDGSPCSSVSVEKDGTLPTGVSISDNVITVSYGEGVALGKSGITASFIVKGTHGGASYQDYKTLSIVPNVTGVDGDGFEQVFYLSKTKTTPAAPQRFDNGNLTDGWYEDYQQTSSLYPYLYVAIYKGEVGKKGITFGTPHLAHAEPKSIASADVLWIAITSDTSAPSKDATWYTDVKDVPMGSGWYVWSCTQVVYSDGTTDKIGRYCVGSADDFADIEEVYALSDSGTTAPTSWSTSVTPTEGNYVWTASKITYTNGTTSYKNALCTGYYGKAGSPGADGTGVVPAYQTATSEPTTKPTVTTKTVYNSNDDLGQGWFKEPQTLSDKVTGGSISNVTYNNNLSGSSWTTTTNSGYTWYKSPTTATNGLSTMRVYFTTSQAKMYVRFRIKAYSEASYDFVLVSDLDSSSLGRESDYSVRTSGNGVETYVDLYVATAGQHYVTVGYGKDASNDSNGDYGLFRIDSTTYVAQQTIIYRCDGSVDSDGNITWGTIYQLTGDKGADGAQGEQGEKGEKGDQGNAGEDAVSISLSSEAITFAQSTSSQSTTVVVYAYKGKSKLTYGTDYTVVVSASVGCTASVSSSGSVSITIPANSKDNAKVGITITVDGETFTRLITVSIAAKGETGQGADGCTVRTSIWKSGAEYHNDSETQNTIKYLDVVYFEDETSSTGYRHYVCKTTHTASSDFSDDSSYWEEMSESNPIYSPLIIAKNAVLNMTQSQHILVGDPDGLHIDMYNGLLEFFSGNSSVTPAVPNIRIGVKNGYTVLSYYDNDGTWLYDLGPDGLDARQLEAAELTSTAYVEISKIGDFEITSQKVGSTTYRYRRPSTNTYESNFFGSGVGTDPTSGKTRTYIYKYTAAKINNVIVKDDTHGLTAEQATKANGKYFTSTKMVDISGNLTNLATGTFIRYGQKVTQAPVPLLESDTTSYTWPRYNLSLTIFFEGVVQLDWLDTDVDGLMSRETATYTPGSTIYQNS